MKEQKMQNNITAKIIADSISQAGVRMTTMELEYPRFILAELNTHKMLSKNSASSRAIPEKAMHKQIRGNPAMPVYWGANQAGMSAKSEITGENLEEAQRLWHSAMETALTYAKAMFSAGLHKQISNRVTEPWMMMKTVLSGTEHANLLWLRDHPDAQPEFQDLAHKWKRALENNVPVELHPGEWHVPYVQTYRSPVDGMMHYFDEKGNPISVETAKKISASCCAQVSYRKNDPSEEKAEDIFDKLINSVPMHASPVEHQATPMNTSSMCYFEPETWEPGVTHVSANGDLWSGNLRGWIQFRKLIPNEAVW